MYAIVEDSGTQIKLSTGDVLEVDVRDLDGDTITLEKVLMIGGDGEPTVGTPYIEGASVAIEVLEEIKGIKIEAELSPGMTSTLAAPDSRQNGYTRTMSW